MHERKQKIAENSAKMFKFILHAVSITKRKKLGSDVNAFDWLNLRHMEM